MANVIQVIYDKYDITPLVTSVEWSGESTKFNRQLSVSVRNTIDGRKRALTFANGKSLQFRNNGTLLFRGVLFSIDGNVDGAFSLKAYDENVYLHKSNDVRKFTNMKASDIIRRLCSDFGIPIGSIADTGYVIPKLIMRDKTLSDIILSALTLTKNQTGKRYFVTNKAGKLYLATATSSVSKYLIEAGLNLTNATYSQSIEDTVTQVKVIGGKKDKYTVKLRNDSLVKLYGVLQKVETMDEKATEAQVQQRARTMLKEEGVINDQATVEAVGIDGVITGTAVYVREPMTGIIGGYYVTRDTHNYEGGVHTMTLELSHTYDLPPIEIDKEALGK